MQIKHLGTQWCCIGRRSQFGHHIYRFYLKHGTRYDYLGKVCGCRCVKVW